MGILALVARLKRAHYSNMRGHVLHARRATIGRRLPAGRSDQKSRRCSALIKGPSGCDWNRCASKRSCRRGMST